MSVEQLRKALEANQVVPTFVIPFYGSSPSSVSVVDAYNALQAEIPEMKVQGFNSQNIAGNQTAVTQKLISIIEEAYNVSITSFVL